MHPSHPYKLFKCFVMKVVNSAVNFIERGYFVVYLGLAKGFSSVITDLIQNSKAVKKVCGPQKGYGEKRCEIQGGGQEMAVMVG